MAALLSISAFTGYSQRNVLVGGFAGGGIATSNNYDVALSGGMDLAVGMAWRSFVGMEVFYQQFSLLYDNEANSARHATGTAGEIISHRSQYVFLAPKFRFCAGKGNHTHFYLNAGVGMNMGGYDSVRKFGNNFTSTGLVRFDSTYDMSENINSMVLRVGLGVTQYIPLGRHWRFTFTGDVGFLPGSLTKSSDFEDVTRTSYSPAKLNPTYISLRIGITHTRFP